MKMSFFSCSVAEKRHGYFTVSRYLGCKSKPDGKRNCGCNQGNCSEDTHVRGLQMHRPAAAFCASCFFSQNLRHQRLHIATLCEVVAVRSMTAPHGIGCF